MILNKLPISAVIFTKNEEGNIVECVDSLIDFSEILVIDSGSTDETIKKVHSSRAKVVHFKWNGKYPKKRQWTLSNVEFQNDWIFFVDADERMTKNLVNELKSKFKNLNSHYSAGLITLDYRFGGKILKFGQKPKKIALLKITDAHWIEIDDLRASGMGELEGHYQPIIQGKIAKINSHLLHADRDPLMSWINRHSRYAEWEAYIQSNQKTKTQVDVMKSSGGKFFHKFPFKAFIYFITSYFFKLGFLDGRAGFDYAFGKAWYYWLIGCLGREELIE